MAPVFTWAQLAGGGLDLIVLVGLVIAALALLRMYRAPSLLVLCSLFLWGGIRLMYLVLPWLIGNLLPPNQIATALGLINIISSLVEGVALILMFTAVYMGRTRPAAEIALSIALPRMHSSNNPYQP